MSSLAFNCGQLTPSPWLESAGSLRFMGIPRASKRASFCTKAPSYKGLRSASEAASRAKQSNRKTETVPERLLRSALWRLGLRFRKNVACLPGNPDIVFGGRKVLVFCDGDFWHGRNWKVLHRQLRARHNSDYWMAKIARNRVRDRANTARLQEAGWVVIRVWETDIKRDAAAVACQIKRVLERRRLMV